MKEYSALKAAWHIDRIADLRQGKDVAPTHLQIVISDLCNQDCHFCAYRMEGGFSTENFADESGNKNPRRMIPTFKVLEILDDSAAMGCKAVEFTGGGEPTVHKDWQAIIGHAQALGMSTGLVTNGVRLDERSIDVLRRLTWMRISLDAGEAHTYERIRRSKAWPKVMEALQLAGSLKGPLVGVGFVVTQENYGELHRAAELVKKSGIAYMRVSAMFSNMGAGYYAGILDAVNVERKRAKALEDETFKVVDFFGDRVQDLEQHAPDYSFCGYQQFTVYVGGNQKVYTCCTNAYTTHGEIGDLKNMRFADWVRDTRRLGFNARTCHDCQFNQANRVLNYMVNPAPAHVDFV